MEPSKEKFSLMYDELPEVSQTLLNIYETTPQWREPAGKILTFDTADKEVVWNNVASLISPNHTAGNSNGPIVAGEGPNVETTSSSAVGDATELSGKKGAGNDLENQENGVSRKSICGIALKPFWFTVILATVVIAAAIGGGVGGGVAAAQGKAGASPDDFSTSNTTGGSSNDTSGGNATMGIASTLTRTTSQSATTSSSITPPGTINSSGGTFSFQAFEKDNFTGNPTAVFREIGAANMPFNATSYVWHRNGTQCCTTFCTGRTWVGWWCQDKTQTSASEHFDNIEIGCSGEESEAYSKAKCATDL